MNGKEINLTSDNTTIKSDNFSVDKNGNMTCNNATIKNATITGKSLELTPSDATYSAIRVNKYNDANIYSKFSYDSAVIGEGNPEAIYLNALGSTAEINVEHNEGSTTKQSVVSPARMVAIDYENDTVTVVAAEGITTPSLNGETLTQASLEKIKKNISPYTEDVAEIIKNSEIYTYNLKTEKDTDKKHIGFVIGDKYKTPKQVLSKEGQGIDLYSMSSLLWKNAQEQQKTIESLLKRVQELEARDK